MTTPYIGKKPNCSPCNRERRLEQILQLIYSKSRIERDGSDIVTITQSHDLSGHRNCFKLWFTCSENEKLLLFPNQKTNQQKNAVPDKPFETETQYQQREYQ
jgi:hypothetical protein